MRVAAVLTTLLACASAFAPRPHLSTATYSFSGGEGSTCSRRGAGVICWGYNGNGNLGLDDPVAQQLASGSSLIVFNEAEGNKVVQLNSGQRHSCALFSAGGVRCWGSNSNGQLGLDSKGLTTDEGDEAGEMSTLAFLDFQEPALTITDIAAGGSGSCAIFSNGKAKCWGSNGNGVLGYSDFIDRADGSGTPLSSLAFLPFADDGHQVTQIALGNGHSCAVFSNNRIRCYGRGLEGQTGNGNVAANVLNDAGLAFIDFPDNSVAVVKVGVSFNGWTGSDVSPHSCALFANGEVRCWGGNFYGQLGQDDTNGRSATNTLGAISFSGTTDETNAIDIDVGSGHTCAVFASGGMKCWGWNLGGQLGYGDTTDRGGNNNDMANLPFISFSKDTSVTPVEQALATDDMSCAQFSDGDTICWGRNAALRLGFGTNNEIYGNDGDPAMNALAPLPLPDAVPLVDLCSVTIDNTLVLPTVTAAAIPGDGSSFKISIAGASPVEGTNLHWSFTVGSAGSEASFAAPDASGNTEITIAYADVVSTYGGTVSASSEPSPSKVEYSITVLDVSANLADPDGTCFPEDVNQRELSGTVTMTTTITAEGIVSVSTTVGGDFSGVGTASLDVTCEVYDHDGDSSAINAPSVSAGDGVHVRCDSDGGAPIDLRTVRLCSSDAAAPTTTCDGFDIFDVYDSAAPGDAVPTFSEHGSQPADRVAFFTPVPRVVEDVADVYIEAFVRRVVSTKVARTVRARIAVRQAENGEGGSGEASEGSALTRVTVADDSSSSISNQWTVLGPVLGAVAGTMFLLFLVAGALYFVRKRKESVGPEEVAKVEQELAEMDARVAGVEAGKADHAIIKPDGAAVAVAVVPELIKVAPAPPALPPKRVKGQSVVAAPPLPSVDAPVPEEPALPRRKKNRGPPKLPPPQFSNGGAPPALSSVEGVTSKSLVQ